MKNKNNLAEELKSIKGNVWYSETEKQFYTVDGDEQKPIKDPKPILDGIQTGLRERTPFLQNVLSAFGIGKTPETTDKQKIENEDYFL